jgi:hypothetical protein
VSVAVGGSGTPHAVTLRGRRVAVAAVLDTWLVEDEWWRSALARRYVALLLADGRVATLFHDLIAGGWYLQHYASR